MVEALKHMGPYKTHEPVAEFAKLSDRAFQLFQELSGGPIRSGESDKQFLAVRLLYIAQVTSIAIRLNSSWALTHPAISLTRDRYEQAVRFSWLARQADNSELEKFLRSYAAKIAKINATVTGRMKEILEGDGFVTEPQASKEERAALNDWESLDLKSMAHKRDLLKPLTKGLAATSLSHFYVSIYQQFSSVSHCDMYAVSMLSLFKNPAGDRVLAPDPFFPAILCLHNALFDIVQCHEACAAYFPSDGISEHKEFLALSTEWERLVSKVTA